jgi:hypothetical protein
MRSYCRFLIVGAVLPLIASFCTAQEQAHSSHTQALVVAAQEGNAKLYSQVIRAEIKAGGLGQHDTVCLEFPHVSDRDPSKSLLKALKSDGLAVLRRDKCLFRGYEIRVEQSTPDSIRVQLVDVRYVDTDLAVILRDGVYVIQQAATGQWNTRDYKPLPPSDRK